MRPAPQSTQSIVGGMRTLRELLIIGFVLAFVAVYADFMRDIWRAGEGDPPEFNDALVTLAGSLAGVLGSAFALSLGVAKPPGEVKAGRLSARVKRPFAGLSLSVTLGIWAYALIGALAAATTIFNIDETPEAVKALSSVFVGYILALASTAFRSVSPA
jgi:hypothetical protein